VGRKKRTKTANVALNQTTGPPIKCGIRRRKAGTQKDRRGGWESEQNVIAVAASVRKRQVKLAQVNPKSNIKSCGGDLEKTLRRPKNQGSGPQEKGTHFGDGIIWEMAKKMGTRVCWA